MNPERTSDAELIPNVLRSWDIVPDDVSAVSANAIVTGEYVEAAMPLF